MGFTHFDEKGKAIMVDVTEKQDTVREATATGKITVNEQQGLWEQRGHRI